MTNKKTLPKLANVNNGYLIITLTKSITPVVWRLELEKAKVAAFEILKKDKKHTLTIKVASKSVEAIAAFKDPEDALEALLAISEALQSVSQKPSIATNSATNASEQKTSERPPQKASTKNNRTAIALLATCIVLCLFYYYWGRTIPTAQNFEAQSISSNANPANQTGVAVSADDLLKGF